MPPRNDAYVPNELLGRLVGYRLYSVQFVMDYVQLRFDGPTDDLPVLNCDVLPIVETPTGSVAPGQLGYADALCAFIPGSVVATVEEMGRGLRIEFADGAICLHPEADEVPGPEIALLSGFTDGEWMCWRPGEDSFADLAMPRSWPAVPTPRTRTPQVDRSPASPDHESRRPIVPNSDVRKQP